MKNKLKHLLLCFLMLLIFSSLFSITASADHVERFPVTIPDAITNGDTTSAIEMEFVIFDDEVYEAIVAGSVDAPAIASDTTGILTIPETIQYNGNTYTVTSIGGSAFDGCTGLTEVILPDTVTGIGSNAFYGCTALTSVNLQNVTSVNNQAFYGCTALTSVNLQNVTSVGHNAFYDCTALTSVNLQNVTSVGNAAFYGCTALTSVNLQNVTSVGHNVFNGCTSLTSVNLQNVTRVDDEAFYDCTSLKVALPSSVNYIGKNTFFDVNTVYFEGDYSSSFFVNAFSSVDHLYYNDKASGWDSASFESATPTASNAMYFSVDNALTNVSTSNTSTEILKTFDYTAGTYTNTAREDYTTTLSLSNTYNDIDLSITSGSTALTAGTHYIFEPSTGVLTINKASITQDITITATGKTITTPPVTPSTTEAPSTNTTPSYGLNVENGSGDGSYTAGTAVIITADTIQGKTFSHWTYDFTSGIANEKSASTTFIMPNTGANVKANYISNTPTTVEPQKEESETFSIKIEIEGDGKVLVNGEEETLVDVDESSSSTFVFTASENWEISDILVNGESVGALGEYTLSNIEKDTSIKAIFTEIKSTEEAQTPINTDEPPIETEETQNDNDTETFPLPLIFTAIGIIIVIGVVTVVIIKKRNKE